jgi:outer membrane protein assembly factor BamD (BamD/ComL family)
MKLNAWAGCFAMVFALVLGHAALAQATERELDDSGDWEVTSSPTPGSGADRLAPARRALAEEKPRRAIEIADTWLATYELSDSAMVPEAYLIRGDARRDISREYKALYDYEAIINGYPASELFPIAVERELEIGLRYVNGLKRRFWGIRFVNASDVGVEILIRVQERMPGSQVAERAAIELADHYYRTRQLKLAAEAYDLYLLNHPNGPNRLHAEKRRIYADIAQFSGPDHDSSTLIDARIRIQEFSDEYPVEAERTGLNAGLVARIDESLAAQLLDSGKWYLKQGDWPAARLIFERLVREQPQTLAAERAMELMEERGWLEAGPPVPPEVEEQAPEVEVEGSADAEVVESGGGEE